MDLGDLLRHAPRRLDEGLAKGLARQLLRGVAHMHGAGAPHAPPAAALRAPAASAPPGLSCRQLRTGSSVHMLETKIPPVHAIGRRAFCHYPSNACYHSALHHRPSRDARACLRAYGQQALPCLRAPVLLQWRACGLTEALCMQGSLLQSALRPSSFFLSHAMKTRAHPAPIALVATATQRAGAPQASCTGT